MGPVERMVRPQRHNISAPYSLQPICSATLYSRCHFRRSCLSHSKFGSNSSFLTVATCLWQADPGLLSFVFQLGSIFSPLHSANAAVTVASMTAATRKLLVEAICMIDGVSVFWLLEVLYEKDCLDFTQALNALSGVGAEWLDRLECAPKLFSSRSVVNNFGLKVCIWQRFPPYLS